MIEDPIVAEIRRYRKEHAVEHGNDLKLHPIRVGRVNSPAYVVVSSSETLFDIFLVL